MFSATLTYIHPASKKHDGMNDAKISIDEKIGKFFKVIFFAINFKISNFVQKCYSMLLNNLLWIDLSSVSATMAQGLIFCRSIRSLIKNTVSFLVRNDA